MVVVRDVVLSAVQAERQQRWRDVFAKWCSLASVEPAHLRAAMLKPAVPGSEETLFGSAAGFAGGLFSSAAGFASAAMGFAGGLLGSALRTSAWPVPSVSLTG